MDIENMYREITLAVSGRDFEKALKAIDAVLGAQPEDPMAIGYAGVIKVATGDLTGGAKMLKKSNELFDATIGGEEEDWVQDIWRQRRSNLGQSVFQLAGESEDKVMQISRLLINEAEMSHERAFKSLAVEAHRSGNFQEAVALLKRAVAEKSDYAPGWYSLACAYAKLSMKIEMIDALKNAIEFGRSEYAMDYRPEISEDSDFDAYREDVEFVELVDTLPKDPELKVLYRTLRDGEPDQVLRLGEKMRATASDLLAVVEAMHEAANLAASDLDEHGSLHSANYEFKESYYIDLKKKLKAEIGDRKRAGAQSKVFRVFKGD